MIGCLTERAERDSDEPGIVPWAVAPETLGKVGRRRAARGLDLFAEIAMPRHRRPGGKFKHPLLQFRRKLPRDKIFVVFDGGHRGSSGARCVPTLPPEPLAEPNVKRTT